MGVRALEAKSLRLMKIFLSSFVRRFLCNRQRASGSVFQQRPALQEAAASRRYIRQRSPGSRALA